MSSYLRCIFFFFKRSTHPSCVLASKSLFTLTWTKPSCLRPVGAIHSPSAQQAVHFSSCAVSFVALYRCFCFCHQPCLCLRSTHFDFWTAVLFFYQVMCLQYLVSLSYASNVKVLLCEGSVASRYREGSIPSWTMSKTVRITKVLTFQGWTRVVKSPSDSWARRHCF